VAEVPIGFVEALVRKEGEAIAEARVRGDLIAPGFFVREVEAELRGCQTCPARPFPTPRHHGFPGALLSGIVLAGGICEWLMCPVTSPRARATGLR
jgi:hypothetical protein